MKQKTFNQFLTEKENKRKILIKRKQKTVTYFYPLGVGGGQTTYGDNGATADATT